MTPRRKSSPRFVQQPVVALLAAAALLGLILPCGAVAQTSSSGEGAKPAAPTVMEPRALDLLRRMSQRLAETPSFGVRTRGMREIPAITGQLLTFVNTAEVTIRRPDRMRAEVAGDLHLGFWYDGATIAVLDPDKRFYARTEAPPRLDAMLSFAIERFGVHFALADFLTTDPYAVLTKGVTNAFWVGRGAVDGVETDHLAFAGPGIEWQIWIESGERALPRRLAVTYTDVDKAPRFLVEFSAWNLGVAVLDEAFRFDPPAWAQRIEFLPRQ